MRKKERKRGKEDGSEESESGSGLAVLVAVVHVLGVGAGVAESLATSAALERFFTGMKAFVLREMVLVLEGLVADVTHEGPNACKGGGGGWNLKEGLEANFEVRLRRSCGLPSKFIFFVTRLKGIDS